jgi:hypothetical protein
MITTYIKASDVCNATKDQRTAINAIKRKQVYARLCSIEAAVQIFARIHLQCSHLDSSADHGDVSFVCKTREGRAKKFV